MAKLPHEFSIGTYEDPQGRWWSYEAMSNTWAEGDSALGSLRHLHNKLAVLASGGRPGGELFSLVSDIMRS